MSKPERMVSVYAIRMHGTPFVKIGVATDAASRVSTLQIGNPYRLSVAHSQKVGSRSRAEVVEKLCHAILAHSAARGEWFGVNHVCAASIIAAAARLSNEQIKRLKAPLSHDYFRRLADRTGEPQF